MYQVQSICGLCLNRYSAYMEGKGDTQIYHEGNWLPGNQLHHLA